MQMRRGAALEWAAPERQVGPPVEWGANSAQLSVRPHRLTGNPISGRRGLDSKTIAHQLDVQL